MTGDSHAQGGLNGSRTVLILGALGLFVASVLLVVAGTGYAVFQAQRQAADLASQQATLRVQAAALAAEIVTLCAEHGDIATAPLTPKSAELGIKIVADFRDAYAGLHCDPPLPAPSPLLRKLARQYGIPVRH